MGAIKGRKLEVVSCPLCGEFSSKRVTALTQHFVDAHGMSDAEVWDSVNGGRPTCACGCGGEVRWNGWGKGYSSVVKGHNGSIYAVLSPEEAAEVSRRRSESLRGKESWAKGLTKEEDERIAARAAATAEGRRAAFERGDIVPWAKGLTKETDSRVAAGAEALRRRFESGEVSPWSKGLDKDTDDRIAGMAARVSLSLQQKALRERLDGMKRLPSDEVRRRIEESGDLTVIEGLNSYVNDASRVIMVRCNRCGENFIGSLRVLDKGRCFKCAPGGSAAQEDVARFVESLGLTVARNDRRTMSMELDIFVRDKGVAVEYNGLYWHCHINKSPEYHSNKTKMAAGAGVSLVHVFEDEWREKRPVVESVIRAKLGMCTASVGARKCRLVELSPVQRREFFERNHLDGDTRAVIAWGLVFGGEVVYGLSLRRPFHRRYDDALEVARCCPALGHSVPGGLSRLVGAARRHCASSGVSRMITYVDTRLGGTGRGYEAAGFVRTNETAARWWWTDLTRRYNRFKFKADSASGRTEAQVAEEAGVVKIWGCENIIYEFFVSPQ